MQFSEINRALGREEDGHLVAVGVELGIGDAENEAEIVGDFLDSARRVLLLRAVGFDGGDFGEVGVAQDLRGNVERRRIRRDGAHAADVLAAVGLDNNPVAFDDKEAALEGAQLVLEGDDDETGAGGVGAELFGSLLLLKIALFLLLEFFVFLEGVAVVLFFDFDLRNWCVVRRRTRRRQNQLLLLLLLLILDVEVERLLRLLIKVLGGETEVFMLVLKLLNIVVVNLLKRMNKGRIGA